MRENASNSALALGSAATPSLKFTGDTNTGIYSPGADQVAISTNGTGRLYIDASGNILAGLATYPTGYGSTYGRYWAKQSAANLYGFVSVASASDAVTYVGHNGTVGAIGTSYGATAGHTPLTFYTSDTERLRITSAGLVGIGTSSPALALHAKGATGYPATSGTTQTGVLRISGGTGIYNVLDMGVNEGTDTAWIQATRANGLQNNDKLLLNPNGGNVGIGTTSPRSLLSFGTADTSGTNGINLYDNGGNYRTGIGATSSYLRLYTPSDGSLQLGRLSTSDGSTFLEAARIDSSGRLGIGTTSPEGKLEVSAGNAEGLRLSSPSYLSTSQGPWIAFNGGPSAGWDLARVQGIRGGGNAEGALVFYTNNGGGAPGTISEKARIDETGRLLVGTSSSRGNWFNTTFADPLVQLEGSSSTRLSITRNDNSDNSGELMLGNSRSSAYAVLSNNDNLGRISFQGADGSEMVAGAYIQCFVDGTPGANDMPGRLVFSTTADGASSPTERMRINSAGEVQVGATSFAFSPRFGISADGVTYSTIQQINNTNTGASSVQMIRFTWNGTSVGRIESTSSATSYLSGSDYRLKDNIQPMTGALEKIAALKPCTFKWKIDGKAGQGFIAHELQEVVADCVSGEKDAVDADGNPEYQGIDQSKLVPLLTAALQEAIGEIKSLKARVVALESA
jgi:hypothetical protein